MSKKIRPNFQILAPHLVPLRLKTFPHLLFLVALGLSPALLRAADLAVVITRETAKCAAVWQREDAKGILAYLPPQVIQKSGGPAAVLRELNEQFDQAHSLGAQSLEVRPGRASTPRQLGRWLATLIPVTAFLHGPLVTVTQPTHVLGLSADQGKHWYFVLLYQTSQAQLNSWFPEFKGRILVPDDPDPQISAGG